MGVWGAFSSGQREGACFLAQHTLLQVCHLVASVLEKGTIIIAWQGVWESSGQERTHVRQHQGVWRVFSRGKSEGADFLAQHTLLQAFVASMLVRNSTLKAWLGV